MFRLDLFGEGVALLLVVAQLRVDGFELFAQEIFLLVFIDAAAHRGADFAFELGDLQLVVEAAFEQFEALDHVHRFQKFLLDIVLDMQYGESRADVLVGVGDLFERSHPLFGKAYIARRNVAHHVLRGTQVRFFQHGVAVYRFQFGNIGVKAAVFLIDLLRPGAVQPPHADAQVIGWKFGDLRDFDDGTHLAHVLRSDFILRGVALIAYKEGHIPFGSLGYGGERYEPARVERVIRRGEYDLAAQGDKGIIDDFFRFRHSLPRIRNAGHTRKFVHYQVYHIPPRFTSRF